MQHPVVLVTGTSSGIGRAAVDALLAKGCHVVATARTKSDIAALEQDRVDVLALDVTKESSMQGAVDATLERHGRIDALVNNAGYGIMLPLEELPMEAMRRMFEVNVFGLQRMTQLVLPHMRHQQPAPGGIRGRIVNVSSAAGHISLPMMGAYCATKFSVRALTTALHAEVRPFGIRTSLIEPGSIKTRFGERSLQETDTWGTDADTSAYRLMHANWARIREGTAGNAGGDVGIISRRIAHACTSRRPRFRYLAPVDARAGRFASRFVPDPATNALTSRYFWRRRDGDA